MVQYIRILSLSHGKSSLNHTVTRSRDSRPRILQESSSLNATALTAEASMSTPEDEISPPERLPSPPIYRTFAARGVHVRGSSELVTPHH